MTDDLLPDLPRPVRRYQVRVTLVQDPGRCNPEEAHALAELAAAALCADGVLGVWSYAESVLSMTVSAEDDAGALSAGVAVVQALGGSLGSTVSAERVRAAQPIGLSRALAHPSPEEPQLFDPARVPEAVRDRLAVIGYWTCSPSLRNRLDHWDELDEAGAVVAANDVALTGSALAR